MIHDDAPGQGIDIYASMTRIEAAARASAPSVELALVPMPASVTKQTLGLAAVSHLSGGTIAYLLFDRIREFARASGGQPASLLGLVIAHEIGHLLLGMKSHSDSGVMQARWNNAQLQQIASGKLIFDRHQSDVMKARLLGPYAAARN